MLTSIALLFLAPGGPAALLDAPAPLPLPAEPAALTRSLFLPDGADAPMWSGSVDLGATLSGGNTDSITAAAQSSAKREWDEHRLTLKAGWNFAEQNDNVGNTNITQRNWFGSGKIDHFYNEQTYSYASVKLENDDIADLHLRQTYSVGLGHKFYDEDDLKLDGEAGVAYVDENYRSAMLPVKQGDDEYIALRFAYDLMKMLSEHWTFLQTVEMVPSVSFSEFNGVMDSRLRNQMSENLYFQLQWIAKYNNNAPTGSTSTDSLWLLSLGWTY
jgi:putative salt-induced outer membrane protein YdiY